MSKRVDRITTANTIIKDIAQKSERVILFFSAGKDSIALLDLMAPHFKEIICVFMYFVKDLEHINRYLRWAETKYNNVRIVQIPHWNLTYILRSGTFCAPNPKVRLLKLSDIDRAMKLREGVEYSFLGMKKADSLNRRLMMNRDGAVIGSKVYPLMDWTNKEVLQYMKVRGLPEPVRYGKKASNGVGFNPECFSYLREHYPGDLKKILEKFPLSEKILIDYDRNNERD
ncbi:MAG: phosphoadenosine phosphosulfate reductase family protein [Bacteroidales bacterium]|nr:phosphoadenosine phosphosulfate reductase family protein [Bacteroidales bacterium]